MKLEPMTQTEQRLLLDNMGLLWKVARSMPAAMTARAEPEDMVQEMVPAFLMLLRKYDGSKAKLATWVVKNLRWLLLRALMRQGFGGNLKPPGELVSQVREDTKSRGSVFFSLPGQVPKGIAQKAEEPSLDADELAALHRAMRQLPARHRAILRLYLEGGRTLFEVGAMLGATAARVRQVVTRALDRLAGALAYDGYELREASR